MDRGSIWIQTLGYKPTTCQPSLFSPETNPFLSLIHARQATWPPAVTSAQRGPLFSSLFRFHLAHALILVVFAGSMRCQLLVILFFTVFDLEALSLFLCSVIGRVHIPFKAPMLRASQ